MGMMKNKVCSSCGADLGDPRYYDVARLFPVWVIKRITGNDSSFVTQYYTGNDDWTYSIDKAEIIQDQDLATNMVRGINSDIEPDLVDK
jgi:hypothetical protein